MKKFTIIYNKVKHPVEADTLPNFQKAVEEAINVPPQNLKIIKPMVKTDAQFLALAAGTELTVMGTQAEKVVKKINNKENGIEYVKEGQTIGFITYVTSSIQMLKSAIELRNYCMDQKDENNPDLLWAIDLGNVFREIEDIATGKPVSPIDIITSWVAYTEDYGDYPYQTYDACEFVEKCLEMLQEGAVADYDEKPDDPNVIHDFMRMSYTAHEKDFECEISDVIDLEETNRVRHTFFLNCSAEEGVTNVQQGIKKYFASQRDKVREVYGVDVHYHEKILGLSKLPLYVLVRINRFKSKDSEKTKRRIQYPKHLSIYDECTEELRNQLKQGIANRDNEFQKFIKSADYEKFVKEFDEKMPNRTDLEKCYAYYEKCLKPEDYKAFIGASNGKFKTSDLNLVGLVTHKGLKIDNDGFFRAVVNRKEKEWYTFKESEVKVVQLNEALKYIGSDADAEEETAHILLYKVVMF